MSWFKYAAVGLALIVATMAGAGALGTLLWNRATARLTSRLDNTLAPTLPRAFDAASLADLPPPVRRYLQRALKDGQLRVARARLTHTGTFNASPTAEQWRVFRSLQHVVVDRPGFVWSAGIAMAPGVAVRVHDAYVAGEGVLHAAAFGLFSVADERGGGELARGELMRFVAEAAWYPTALLPGPRLAWSPVDDRSARAVFDDGGLRVELVFVFGADDLIDRVRATRGRTTDGRVELLPWEGRFWNYAERDGMTIPLDGEVAWITPDGPRPYWRGTLDTIAYEYAR